MITEPTINLLYRHVGREIGRRRRGKFTQQQLADIIGVSRTSVTNLEKGRQRVPLHYLLHLAEVLACEISDLLPSRSELAPTGDTLGQMPVVGDLSPSSKALIRSYTRRP